MGYTNNNVPMNVSADVTADMLLEVSGDGTVAEAGAASANVVGTAYSDVTLASGEKVAVITGVEVTLADSGAGVTAGDLLQAGASSTVTTYSDTATYVQNERAAIIGRALNTAAAGEDVRVLLFK